MNSTNKNGFTLLELLIVIAISGIIVIGLMRLYKSSVWSYSLQTQLTEMNQNATYTIKRISDVIIDAGGDLSQRAAIMTQPGADTTSIDIRSNPRGGEFIFTYGTATTVTKIGVKNSYKFKRADSVLICSFDSSLAPVFIRLISVDSAKDSLTIGTARKFFIGDTIYSFKHNRYYLNNGNLCLNNNATVMAENIDTLVISLRNDADQRTTDWTKMKSVLIKVTARTSLPDPGYNGSIDKYRRITLTLNSRLKNKL